MYFGDGGIALALNNSGLDRSFARQWTGPRHSERPARQCGAHQALETHVALAATAFEMVKIKIVSARYVQ
jgi:hypothetical protein